jgi:hypothetical protein
MLTNRREETAYIISSKQGKNDGERIIEVASISKGATVKVEDSNNNNSILELRSGTKKESAYYPQVSGLRRENG